MAADSHEIPKYQRNVNFEYLVDGYSRKLKQNIPSAISQIILLYHPKMNGYEYKWKLNLNYLNLNSLDESFNNFDSNAFDVGLPNKFFLRAKKTDNNIVSVHLMSFPLSSKFGSMIIHSQFYCDELQEQSSNICPVNATSSSNHKPFEIEATRWCLVISTLTAPSFTIECTLNILKISAFTDTNSSQQIWHRSRSNNNHRNNIVLYNYQIISHKTDNMQFLWNIHLQNNVKQIKQIVSGIYHNIFQFIVWSPNVARNNNLKFGIQICGLPHNAHRIGVKMELSYFNHTNNEMTNILSRIDTFGYDKCMLLLDEAQNNILSKKLVKYNKLQIFCKANIIARYGMNNDCLSLNNYSQTTDTNDTIDDDEKSQSRFIEMKCDSFVWNISDPSILNEIKTKFSSNSGLNSDPFELHEHQWYISIQPVKPNRYLSAPSVSEQNCDHKQLKISIDCLGFSSRESMDCKITIYILQNGLKSTFYQKFPGRYFRDKEDTFLECNALCLTLFNKLSIKIEMAVVNHKDDDVLTIKESRNERKKQKVFSRDVKLWLTNSVHLAEYVGVFRNNNINNMEIIKSMTKDDLKCIGINKIGDRIRLWTQIQLLCDSQYRDDADNNEDNHNNVYRKQNKSRKRKHEIIQNDQHNEPPTKKPRICIKNGKPSSVHK